MFFRYQSLDSIVDKTIIMQELSFSKTFNKNERINCQNNSIAQCNNDATNEKRKEKNEKIIKVGEKPTKNVKIKRIS